jgi:hypothetical protein
MIHGQHNENFIMPSTMAARERDSEWGKIELYSFPIVTGDNKPAENITQRQSLSLALHIVNASDTKNA